MSKLDDVMSEVVALLGDVPTVHVLRDRAWDVPPSPGRSAGSAFRITLSLDDWGVLETLTASAAVAGVSHHFYGIRGRSDLVGDASARSIVHELGGASWDARERLVWMAARLVEALRAHGHVSGDARAHWHGRLCAGTSHVEATFPHLVALVEKLPGVRLVEETWVWRGGFGLAMAIDSWRSLSLLEHCALSANVRLQIRAGTPVVHAFEHHGTDAGEVVDRLALLGETVGEVVQDEGLIEADDFVMRQEALWRFVDCRAESPMDETHHPARDE